MNHADHVAENLALMDLPTADGEIIRGLYSQQ